MVWRISVAGINCVLGAVRPREVNCVKGSLDAFLFSQRIDNQKEVKNRTFSGTLSLSLLQRNRVCCGAS